MTVFFRGIRFKSAAVPERRLRMSMDVCACRRLSLIPCSPSLRKTAKKASRDQKHTAQRGAFCTWAMICNHACVHVQSALRAASRCGNIVRLSCEDSAAASFSVSFMSRYSFGIRDIDR